MGKSHPWGQGPVCKAEAQSWRLGETSMLVLVQGCLANCSPLQVALEETARHGKHVPLPFGPYRCTGTRYRDRYRDCENEELNTDAHPELTKLFLRTPTAIPFPVCSPTHNANTTLFMFKPQMAHLLPENKMETPLFNRTLAMGNP